MSSMRMDSASMSSELWFRGWRRLGGWGLQCWDQVLSSPVALEGSCWSKLGGGLWLWNRVRAARPSDHWPWGLGFIIPHSSDRNLDDLGSGNNGIPEPRTSVPMISKLNNFAGEEKKYHWGKERNSTRFWTQIDWIWKINLPYLNVRIFHFCIMLRSHKTKIKIGLGLNVPS